MKTITKNKEAFTCIARNGEYDISILASINNMEKENVLDFKENFLKSAESSHKLGKKTESNLIHRYHLDELEKRKNLILKSSKNSVELNNMLCAAYLALQMSCNIYHDISCPPKEGKSRKTIHDLQEQLSSDLLEFYYSLDSSISVDTPTKKDKMRFIDKIFNKDGTILYVQIKNGSPVNQSVLNNTISKLIQDAVSHERVDNLTIVSTRDIDGILKKASTLPFNKKYLNVIYLADILSGIITYTHVLSKHGENIEAYSTKLCNTVTSIYSKMLEELSNIY